MATGDSGKLERYIDQDGRDIYIRREVEYRDGLTDNERAFVRDLLQTKINFLDSPEWREFIQGILAKLG